MWAQYKKTLKLIRSRGNKTIDCAFAFQGKLFHYIYSVRCICSSLVLLYYGHFSDKKQVFSSFLENNVADTKLVDLVLRVEKKEAQPSDTLG